MEKQEYLQIYEAAEKYYKSCGADYFRKVRGLSPQTIEKFGLGSSKGNLITYSGVDREKLVEANLVREKEDHDIFRYRAIIPIRNEFGETVAFGGRVTGDWKPKYLNSPTTEYFKKSELLFGEDSIEWSDEIIVCEGYMDLIALRDHGITNSVAVLGTALTEQHIEKIIRHGVKKFLLLFDTDEPGRLAVERSIERIKAAAAEIEIEIPSLLPAKDPDEFLKKHSVNEFRSKMKDAEACDSFLAKRSVENLVDILLERF